MLAMLEYSQKEPDKEHLRHGKAGSFSVGFEVASSRSPECSCSSPSSNGS